MAVETLMLDGLIFDPVVPRTFIVAGATVLCAFTLLNYARPHPNAGAFRRGFLALLRVASILALAAVLMRPMRDTSEPVARTKPVFFVLVDGSRSMSTNDADGMTRFQAVKRSLEKNANLLNVEMRRDADVEFLAFGEGVSPSSLDQLLAQTEGAENATDLAQSLTGLAQNAGGRNVTGALLLSDGRDTAGGPVQTAAAYLRSMRIPVFTTTFGTQTQTQDVSVGARLMQNFLFRGQPGTLGVTISQTGYDGWYANVELYRGDRLERTEQVRLTSAVSQIQFPIREEERGLIKYNVKVAALAGDADSGNNERTVFAQVVDEKAKVLFIEGEPYWDSKFLLRSLQADPNLEVTAIFNMSPRRSKLFAVTQGREDGGNAVRMPNTKAELYRYDCIFLGRGTDTMFSADQLRLFKHYLEERGGGIIFSRGPSHTGRDEILAELEPVIWDDGVLARARFELTPAGSTSPIFNLGGESSDLILRELPEMISIARVKEEKSLAIVLARTEDDAGAELATIAYHRYGKGRVMTVGSTGLWRWAFMRKEFEHYDRVYARFWGQMIRWIVYGSDFLPGQDISFSLDRSAFQPGESVAFAVQTKLVDSAQYAPRILITGPDGESLELDPAPAGANIYTAAFVPEREGEYEAVLHNNVGSPESESARFVVYSDSVETRHVAANPELMMNIAEWTGGRVLTPEQWADLPRESRARAPETTHKPKPVDVWDRYSVFASIVGLLAIEWLIRRRTGLL
jgi:hypothetical protein